MEEEEEGRKGAGSVEEKDVESRGKKDMQDKLNKLFSQPADPWVSAGGLQLLLIGILIPICGWNQVGSGYICSSNWNQTFTNKKTHSPLFLSEVKSDQVL